MRKLILAFFLFASALVFGCKCHFQSFGENFAKNDFVAEIEILKTYDVDFKTESDGRFYKADIKILNLYKGKTISSILIRGKLGQIFGPACEVKISKGDQFLVYVDSKSDFGISSCTPRKLLTDKNIEVERKAIQFLLKKEIENTNCFYFSGNYFKKFKNLIPKHEFAVYQLKVNAQSKVESISVIQDFGTAKDEEIKRSIKKNFTVLQDFMREMKNEKVILVLFFDKNNPDIISNFIVN